MKAYSGKLEATKTMLITVFDGANKFTLVVPNFCMTFEANRQHGKMIFHIKGVPMLGGKPLLEEGRIYNVVASCTNDPTPGEADGLVSLGYYKFSYIFRQCTFTGHDPMTFEGWVRLFENQVKAE